MSIGITQSLAEPIRGAGSTFAAPIIAKWSKAYTEAQTDGGDFTSPDWQVDSEPVGSLAGIMRRQQPEPDSAATETLRRRAGRSRAAAQHLFLLSEIQAANPNKAMKRAALTKRGFSYGWHETL